jgi:hypothetical protein
MLLAWPPLDLSLSVTKEDAFKVADEEYRRLETVQLVSSIVVVAAYGVAGFDLVSLASFSDYSFALFRTVAVLAGVLVIIGLIGIVYSGSQMRGTFSSLEGEARHFLINATKALEAYVPKGKEKHRKRAVRQLKDAADVIDRWSGGNLSYLKSSEDKVNDFAKAFRSKLIHAVAEANPTQADEYHSWVSLTENNILNMGEANLDAWTGWLLKLNVNASVGKTKRRLMTIILNLVVVVSVLVIGYEVFILVKALPGATFDGPITAAGLVWGPAYTAYLTFVVQRYLPRREQSQKPPKGKGEKIASS